MENLLILYIGGSIAVIIAAILILRDPKKHKH